MLLRSDENGQVAIIVALCILPLLFLSGFMIDFSRQQSVSRKAQVALDAAAISVALLLQDDENVSVSELTVEAQKVFDGNLVADASFVPGQVMVVRDGDIATLNYSAATKTGLAGLMGVDELSFSLSSAAQYAGQEALIALDIALVLDVSESMRGERIDALRQAAYELVDFAIPDDTSRVRMGIVPFNNYVNIGRSNVGATWLTGTEPVTDNVTFCSFDEPLLTAQGCTFARECPVDAEENERSCPITATCPEGVSEARTVCQTISADFEWLGCVKERTTPLDVTDESYGSDPIVAEVMRPTNSCYLGNEILPLTNDLTDIRASIANLRPVWPTYIPSGVTWGQRVLSPQAPFELNEPVGERSKAIILMSDGANTRSINPSDMRPHGTDTDEANDRLEDACDEAKEAGTLIFTIAFLVNDIRTEQLLRDCASDPAGNFRVDGERELTQAFLTIASEFTQIALVE